MNWRSVFFDNIGFKLAALVVVAMLWVSVTADERQAQPVPTEVSVQVRDTAWVLVESPGQVNTTFQGPNRALLGLLMEKPVVHIEVDSVTDEQMRMPLQVDRVEYDQELSVAPSYITPSAIDLRFERRRSRRVPVVADVNPIPAPGYTVVPPIEVQPESVTVRGPASWVEGLTRISTRSVRLEDLSNTVVRDIALDLPAGVRGAQADPATVLVTINLDSLVVRNLRVPVRPTGAGASGARVQPDSVTVGLRGVASAVDELAGRIDAVSVEVASPPRNSYQVTLGVAAEAEGPVAVEIEPPAATVGPRT